MRNTPEKRLRLVGYIQRLPFVGSPSDVPESDIETSAVLQALRKNQPQLYESIKHQTDLTLEELKSELDQNSDNKYLLSDGELLSVVSRASRAGAAIVLSAIGKTSDEVQSLEEDYSQRWSQTPPDDAA